MLHNLRRLGHIPWTLWVWPLVVLLVLESVERGSLISTLLWIFTTPGPFLLSYLLLFAIINLFAVLFTGRAYKWLCYLSFLLFLVISTISRVKLDYRGEPLLPTDLALSQEGGNIAKELNGAWLWYYIIAIAVSVLVLPWLFRKWKPRPIRPAGRIIATALSALFIFALFTGKLNAAEQRWQVYPITWDQEMNYDHNGLAVGFMLDAELMRVKEPAGYSQAAVNQILAPYVKSAQMAEPKVKPNIIIVMSEAFWDPTMMKNVKFSQDPIPNFHAVQKNYTSGILLSPVYGGGTANTEFEALTGFSMQNLPQGSTAYAQYVNRPLPSFARILTAQGYEASAVHTYQNWFYRRDQAYKELGFNRFISGEFFANPVRKGDYIVDSMLMDRVASEMRATPQPDFIYAVSMENHGPYENPLKPIPVRVTSGLTGSSKDILERYMTTAHDADASLEQLIQSVQKSGQPTLIAFFGDHLPMLGNDYQVYKDAGYFKDDTTYDGYMKMHSVPFVIWDNFLKPSERKHNLMISPSFLQPLMLNLAGLPGDAFTRYLQGLYDSGVHYIPRPDYDQASGITPSKLQPLDMLQYDMMFGSGYAYGSGVPKPDANNGFLMGSGPIRIDSVAPDQTAASGTYTLKGQNFAPIPGGVGIGGVVLADGKSVPAHFVDSSEVSIHLNVPAGKSVTLQYLVKDSMNRVIAKSPPFTYKP